MDPEEFLAMEPFQRDAIARARPFFIEHLSLLNIQDELVAKGIFTDVMIEYIVTEKTNTAKVRRLLTDLSRRPKSCYKKFVDLLRERGEEHCADELLNQEQIALRDEERRQAAMNRFMPSSAPPSRGQPSIFNAPQQVQAEATNGGFQFTPSGHVPASLPPSAPGLESSPSSTAASSSSSGPSQTSAFSSSTSSSLASNVTQETGYEDSRSELATGLAEQNGPGARSALPSSFPAPLPVGGTSSTAMNQNANASSGEAYREIELMEMSDDELDLNAEDDAEIVPPPVSQPSSRNSVASSSPSSMYLMRRQQNEEMVYKHDSSPRGMALIINNKHFALMENREGTELDGQRLETMLRRFGYSITVKHNLQAEQMKETIQEFASNPDLMGVDSCIMAILSHGNDGEIIFGTDGFDDGYQVSECINLREIQDILNSQRCPGLKYKPKLLIIQACRGENEDRSLSSTGMPETSDAPSRDIRCDIDVEPDEGQGPAVRNQTSLTREHPAMADFLVAYPTCPGFVAYRHVREGSPFIKFLTETFLDQADNMHVMDMITEVNRKLAEEFNHPQGHLTMSSNEHQLLRQWYLNPPTAQ